MKIIMILVTPLKLQICAEHILFFDMDDTLINTNFANFLAYQKAFFAVTHAKLNANYHPKQSFNRKALKKAAPHLNQQTYDNVIQEKERLYHEFLVETELNNHVADILFRYCKTNRTILVTNCRKNRALLTLDFWGLTHKFSSMFFKKEYEEKTNKYQNAINSLEIAPELVIAFENERDAIQDALKAGVLSTHIISL